MTTVAIAPDLYKRVEIVAQENQSTPEDIFNEAVRRYLWELSRRKISEEMKHYRSQHAELKALYLGQYIAMKEGQVVDCDKDFDALRQRVRKRFGDAPVMMTRVEETAETVLTRRGFRLETPLP